MGYVIAAILVLLIVGGFVLFLVTNATRKSNVSDAGDPGAEQNSLSVIGSDDHDGAEVARPVVGGEAEGGRSPR